MPCARSAFESFVHLFKGGGVQGRSPCPRSAERGTFLCSFSAGGGLRGDPRRGFPLFFTLYVCAVTLGGGRWPLLPFDPISLVLAQRNGVEPPKKSAFLPCWLHHPRERCRSVDGTFLARLWGGGGCGAGRGRDTHICENLEAPREGSLQVCYFIFALRCRSRPPPWVWMS